MFGLGIWEIALIAVVALLVLGPDKLPDAARSIGKALRDFRRAGDDIKREIIGDLDAPPRPTPPIVAKPAENVLAQADPHAAPVADPPADAPIKEETSDKQ